MAAQSIRPEIPEELAVRIRIVLASRTPIGEVIADYRKDLGLTQKQLGTLLGLQQQMISDLESGSRYLHASDVLKVCAVLGINPMKATADPDWNRDRPLPSYRELEARSLLVDEIWGGRSIRELKPLVGKLAKWLDEVEQEQDRE